MGDFFELAHRQRAYRFLRPDPIPDEIIERLLDAAIRAPSAQNMQPWEFVVVQDEARRKAIADHAQMLWENFAREYSRPEVDTYQWRHTDEWAMGRFAEAPVIIVVCGNTELMPLELMGSSIFPATQNILLGALDLGLGSLLSTLPIFQPEGSIDILGLPQHVVPLAAIPIGYPERVLGPPKRIPFEEKTHRDTWATPWKG
jgi:nitroreductase